MDFGLIDQLKKTQKSYELAKSAHSPLLVMESVFNQEERAALNEFRAEAYSLSENLRYRQGEGSSESDVMAWPSEELQEKLRSTLLPKVQHLLPENIEFGFAFHKNFHPYGLHTDAGYDPDEVILKQGIIPLEIFPEEAHAHTVIMKQRCYFSSSFPAKRQYPKDIQPVVNEMKSKWVEEFSSQRPFDGPFLAKYWKSDEFHKEWLQGFEIDHVFEWKLGSMAVWDRSQIHCSSDFENFGLKYKVGLMWVSRLAQD